MWQHQGSQRLGQDSGAAFWGAGLVGPDSRNHTLLQVGTGLERRTSSHEETHQTLVSPGNSEFRKAQGKSLTQQTNDASRQEMCREVCPLLFLPMLSSSGVLWECFGMGRQERSCTQLNVGVL